MRILVTGGAGFIGSHLCARLLQAGHEVASIDNYFTGRLENIQPLIDRYPLRFTAFEHDVTDALNAHDGFDQVYNLACPASPPHYQFDAIKTLGTSYLGAVNVLELARRTGARVLQASTSEIYGDPMVHPQPESYWGNVNPIGPRACYDEGKRIAETLFMAYARQHGVETRIIRIFNTYGPNMRPDDGRVVSNFIMQALRDEDITIYGDGSQTRSFQYVDDLIEGMIRTMNGSYSDPINIGNPGEFTVRQLADVVTSLVPGCKSKVITLPLPQDDPQQRKPDISVAQHKLDWEPNIRLHEGLVPTIKYFAEQLSTSHKAQALVYMTTN